MEIITVNNSPVKQLDVVESSSDGFIEANTKNVSLNHLRKDCIIPVFAKDNESTISHDRFIDCTEEVVNSIFQKEKVLNPSIRTSHIVKGRTPEARGKATHELLESEKTIYYERMMFLIDIPTISEEINGNTLSLSVGGVRAYNHENLYNRKTEERFKIFVGFKNMVCTNLCISTDGFKEEIRVRDVFELKNHIYKLISEFDAAKQLSQMREFNNYSLEEPQFAKMVGRAKMFQCMPNKIKQGIYPFPLSDTQVSMVTKEFHRDENFCCDANSAISLWNLYNLFTGSNKSSYIDTFLNRGKGSYEFISTMKDALENDKHLWYIN